MEDDVREMRPRVELVRLTGDAIFTGVDTEAGEAVQRLAFDLEDTVERLNEAYNELFHAVFSKEAAHG